MLLSKLISVLTLAVLVFAQSDSDGLPRVRSKRTIGVVLTNLGGLFGYDIVKRPPAVPSAAATLTDNVRKSFTIALNWNKNRTQANLPAAAPAAAPAPAAPAAPAAPKPAAPAAPKPASAPAPVPAAAGPKPAAPAAPPKPAGPPTKAQLYVELVDNSGKLRESQDKEEEEEEDDTPKRIQIGLPDYSSVDYNEVKRDIANQGNNDFDHSKEKFKQEFNNFWEGSPWTVQHGYKFIVPQGPVAGAGSTAKEFELPKSNNVRSLKIVHNVKVYRQPTKTESYNEVDNQNYIHPVAAEPLQQLHIVDEEGVRYIVNKNGKKMQLPSNLNALILEYFKKKFQADAEAQAKAARDAQNAIQSNKNHPTPAPIVYKAEHVPEFYIPAEIFKDHFESIQKELEEPIIHTNQEPEVTKERHIYKVNHYHNDETPSTPHVERPESIQEPEYLDIKEKVEAGPPQNYIKVGSHENLNSYIANARPGQVVNIKIVEPSKGDFSIKRHGYDDTDDVHKHVEKEKDEVAEKNKDVGGSPKDFYPGFNYKEFEKVGYPNYEHPKDKDFFPGFTEEEKRNLEDHYHFFSSAHDPRGRDKGKIESTSHHDNDRKQETKEKPKTTNFKTEDSSGEKPNFKTEDRPEKIQSEERKEVDKKEEVEDDDEEEEAPQKIKEERVEKEDDDDDRRPNVQAQKESEDEDEEKEHAQNIRKETETEKDDDRFQSLRNKETESDDDDDEPQQIQKKTEHEEEEDDDHPQNIRKEAEDEDDDDRRPQHVQKEAEAEEEDDDDEEEVAEKENVTQQDDDEVEDDEEESRQKIVKDKESTREEAEEAEEDEEEAEPSKLHKKEDIKEEAEDDEEESDDKSQAKEKESLNEVGDDDEEEVENDDQESKQRPRIVYSNTKENFEVEDIRDVHKNNEAESESQSAATSHKEEGQDKQASGYNDKNFASELDTFINSHFKDTKHGYKDTLDINGEEERKTEKNGAPNAIKNRLRFIENVHEKEFDKLFSTFGEGMEYEDFYKQFNRDSKFVPSKQNLIDAETKKVHPKEQTQQPDASIVQPLYSGILYTPPVQELFKSDKPLTVPFDVDYSASETKSRSLQRRRFRRNAESDDDETDINEFQDESRYVPDTYSSDFNYEAPEPKMPDFAKLEAKQYKDDDTLSPRARVSKAEDGQKTTWISIKVPVTYTVNSQT